MSIEARREIGELLAAQPLGDEDWQQQQEVAWLQQCGSCDAGLPMQCTCPDGDVRSVLLGAIEGREQARGMVVELEGENHHLETERDDLILRLERAVAALSEQQQEER